MSVFWYYTSVISSRVSSSNKILLNLLHEPRKMEWQPLLEKVCCVFCAFTCSVFPALYAFYVGLVVYVFVVSCVSRLGDNSSKRGDYKVCPASVLCVQWNTLWFCHTFLTIPRTTLETTNRNKNLNWSKFIVCAAGAMLLLEISVYTFRNDNRHNR